MQNLLVMAFKILAIKLLNLPYCNCRKTSKAKGIFCFLKKAPSQIFDWVLNMPLQNTDSNSGKIKSASKKLNN